LLLVSNQLPFRIDSTHQQVKPLILTPSSCLDTAVAAAAAATATAAMTARAVLEAAVVVTVVIAATAATVATATDSAAVVVAMAEGTFHPFHFSSFSLSLPVYLASFLLMRGLTPNEPHANTFW
jgi:hypothetical protein